jgi:LEA14-like dessication related protein
MHLMTTALVACALLPGCSMFMQSMERPQIAVREVSLAPSGLAQITGRLRLDVTNPNDFGVPLTGIAWQLSINGARAMSGRVELSQTIPARGVAPVTTTLTLGLQDAIAAGSALAGGARDYQLDARLQFSAGFGRLEVAVAHAGNLGEALGAR